MALFESWREVEDLKLMLRATGSGPSDPDAQSVASFSSGFSRTSNLSRVSANPSPHAVQRSIERSVTPLQMKLTKKHGHVILEIHGNDSVDLLQKTASAWGQALRHAFPQIAPRKPERVMGAATKRVELNLDGSDGIGIRVKQLLTDNGFFKDASHRLKFVHESADGEETVVVEGFINGVSEIITVFFQNRTKKQTQNRNFAKIWEALKKDDSKALMTALQDACRGDGWNSEDGASDSEQKIASVMLRLEHVLWHHRDGHGPLQTRRFGLIPAAAGTDHVPPDGALRCLHKLLSSFKNDGSAWSKQQLGLALCMARKRHRFSAMLLLQTVIKGTPLPTKSVSIVERRDFDWAAIIELLTRDPEIAHISALESGVRCMDGAGCWGLFDGAVVEGRPVGCGTFTKFSGEKISGFYTVQGYPSGNCFETHTDGTRRKYIGARDDNGQAHGRGILYGPDGMAEFDGWWVHGKESRMTTCIDLDPQGPAWLSAEPSDPLVSVFHPEDFERASFRPPWVAQQAMKQAIEAVQTTDRVLGENRTAAEEWIRDHFSRLIQALRTREEELLAEVKSVWERKHKALGGQGAGLGRAIVSMTSDPVVRDAVRVFHTVFLSPVTTARLEVCTETIVGGGDMEVLLRKYARVESEEEKEKREDSGKEEKEIKTEEKAGKEREEERQEKRKDGKEVEKEGQEERREGQEESKEADKEAEEEELREQLRRVEEEIRAKGREVQELQARLERVKAGKAAASRDAVAN